jgi:hypothetical protein
LPIEEYPELMENLEDLAMIAERKDEPTFSLEDVIKELSPRSHAPAGNADSDAPASRNARALQDEFSSKIVGTRKCCALSLAYSAL